MTIVHRGPDGHLEQGISGGSDGRQLDSAYIISKEKLIQISD